MELFEDDGLMDLIDGGPKVAQAAPPAGATSSPAQLAPVRVASVSLLEQQLERKIAKDNLPVLGALVWWSFTNVELELAAMKGLLTTVGLEEKLSPTPEPRGALKDAIDSLHLRTKIGRHKIDDKRFAFTFDTSEVTPGQAGQASTVRYVVDQVIEYNYEDQKLTFKNDFMKPEIEAAFQKYLKTLKSDDLRTIVQRALITGNAITVREKGGVYFVPRQALPIVDKLRELCSKISETYGEATFNRLRIADEPEERQDMLNAAGLEIETELAEAETEIQEILAKVKEAKDKGEKSSVRESTLKRRIEDFKKIKTKALAYADLLNYNADSVGQRVDSLNQQVLALL